VLVDGVSAPIFKTASTNLGVRTVLPRPQSWLLTFNEPVSLRRRFMDANVLWCGSRRLGKRSWYNRWAMLSFPSVAPNGRRISVILFFQVTQPLLCWSHSYTNANKLTTETSGYMSG
jgi:hypothetical protein